MLRPNIPMKRGHARLDNADAPMGALAQTKLSWAKQVRSFDELADVYGDRLRQLLGTAKLPYTVLTPAYAWSVHRENEKLVFIHDGRLHVWERTRSGPVCTSCALQDIHLLECTNILLSSRIRIHGAASDGKLTTTSFRFNSVTGYLFDPFIQEVRGAGGDSPDAEMDKLASLCKPNLKFMNYARRALGPEDTVLDALWQPEIRASLFTFLGRSIYRNIATTHLVILTRRECISLREDESSPRGDNGIRYGGVWTYIPLSKITATALTKTDTNLLALSVQLPGNDSIQSLFLPDQKGSAERFVSRIGNDR